MQRTLSKPEIIILDKIKSLTDNNGYGTVEIVIRAGSIELVTTSEKTSLANQREEPGSPASEHN